MSGSLGLSAINIVFPVLNICMAVTFVFEMGGNALIGKLLGEGKKEQACSFFSLIMIINLAVMAIMMAVFLAWGEEIYMHIGADEELLPLLHGIRNDNGFGRACVVAPDFVSGIFGNCGQTASGTLAFGRRGQ